MKNFCYLYITNDDVFAKCSFVLICNVLFAKFIKTPIFCTLHYMCAILFLHIWWCMCNFFTTVVIFAHVINCVKFYFCTHIKQCAIFPNR